MGSERGCGVAEVRGTLADVEGDDAEVGNDDTLVFALLPRQFLQSRVDVLLHLTVQIRYGVRVAHANDSTLCIAFAH